MEGREMLYEERKTNVEECLKIMGFMVFLFYFSFALLSLYNDNNLLLVWCRILQLLYYIILFICVTFKTCCSLLEGNCKRMVGTIC